MDLAESIFDVASNLHSGVLVKIGSNTGNTDFGPCLVYDIPTINFEVNSHCAWLMKVISFFPNMDQIWDHAIKKGKDQVVIWLQFRWSLCQKTEWEWCDGVFFFGKPAIKQLNRKKLVKFKHHLPFGTSNPEASGEGGGDIIQFVGSFDTDPRFSTPWFQAVHKSGEGIGEVI